MTTTQAHAIRIGANLHRDLCLWKEIVNTAVYLHNRTQESLEWNLKPNDNEVLYTHSKVS